MIDPNDDQIIRPREFLLGGVFVVFVVSFIALVLVIHGFSEDGSSADLPTPTPSPSPVPSDSPAQSSAPADSGSPGATDGPAPTDGSGQTLSPPPETPLGADEERIEELARNSVEFLPAGSWPELYDDFTSAFQDRCEREEFIEAGQESAEALGSNLSLLGFVRLDNLSIVGDRATASIVAEVRGQPEYSLAVAFAIEDGTWKLSPAAGTSGCSAFNRTSG